jgi:hypothetical protein
MTVVGRTEPRGRKGTLEDRQNAIAGLRLDPIGIDLDRERDRAVEVSRDPLAPMQADLFAVVDRLFPRDAQGIALGFELDVALVDARQFHHGDKIMTLLEDVDRRERLSDPIDR